MLVRGPAIGYIERGYHETTSIVVDRKVITIAFAAVSAVRTEVNGKFRAPYRIYHLQIPTLSLLHDYRTVLLREMSTNRMIPIATTTTIMITVTLNSIMMLYRTMRTKRETINQNQ